MEVVPHAIQGTACTPQDLHIVTDGMRPINSKRKSGLDREGKVPSAHDFHPSEPTNLVKPQLHRLSSGLSKFAYLISIERA